MKKIAFTMVELTIAIIVILILTAASMSMVKNINANKNRILVYAAIQSLNRGNIAIIEKYYGEFYPEDPAKKWDDEKTTDWYCNQVADNLTLNGNASCADNLGTGTVNFTFPNGITFYGISSAWKRVGTSDVYYKSIMVDINGAANPNKIGVDKYPLRIFRGQSARVADSFDGLIYPVNCSGTDRIEEGNLDKTYCDSASNNMASTNDVIAYNVYRVVNANTPKSAGMIISSQSAIKADCMSHGGKGLYGPTVCASALGADLYAKCAREATCEGCGALCPNGGDEAGCNTLSNSNKLTIVDDINPALTKTVGFPCFTLISKPTSGLGILGSSILGELGL